MLLFLRRATQSKSDTDAVPTRGPPQSENEAVNLQRVQPSPRSRRQWTFIGAPEKQHPKHTAKFCEGFAYREFFSTNASRATGHGLFVDPFDQCTETSETHEKFCVLPARGKILSELPSLEQPRQRLATLWCKLWRCGFERGSQKTPGSSILVKMPLFFTLDWLQHRVRTDLYRAKRGRDRGGVRRQRLKLSALMTDIDPSVLLRARSASACTNRRTL
eukprot:6192524-Pleurochrysis_carterae.AAC.1